MTPRPTTAAFFDVDDTVLTDSSGKLYTQYMARKGKLGRRDIFTALYTIALHRMGRLDARAVAKKLLARSAGYPVEQMRAECEQWFREMVTAYVSADAVETIRAHQGAGHRVLLLSASTQFVCDPLAAHLEMDGVLCSRMLSEGGKLTGEIGDPFCYGEGKRVAIERYALEGRMDLARCYFYTDSITDLPALEAVGHAVAVNADTYLRREARLRGWALRRWGRPGEAGARGRAV